MELIYSMKRLPLRFEPPHYLTGSDPELNQPLCTVSINNIIAFTSCMELDDVSGDTYGGHVYVCDIETPWHCHKVTTTVYPITCLQWDEEGRQLLVGTTSGEVRVYVQTDFLLNKWHEEYNALFEAEHILKARFFHNGRKVIMNETKPDAPVTERIQVQRSTPTLKGFGGSPSSGLVVVTHTSLLGVCARVGHSARVSMECLGRRDRVTCADIIEKDGAMLICTVSRGFVRTYSMKVSGGGGGGSVGEAPLPVTVTIMHAFHAPDAVSIRWWVRDDGDCILVGGQTVSLWKLVEKSHPIHKYLQKTPVQGSTTPGGGQKPPECHISQVWQQISQWRVSSDPCHVCDSSRVSRVALVRNKSKLFVITHDLPRELNSLVIVPTTDVSGSVSPPKKSKFTSEGKPISACVVASSLSPLGGCAVTLDTHSQIHTVALRDKGDASPSALQLNCTLLEYAMCAGADLSDLLLTLDHNTAEMLLDRIMEQFQRQAPSYQQHYYQRWLQLRLVLSRTVPNLETAAGWVSCLTRLEAGWAGAAAALRPDDKPEQVHKLLDAALACHDKNVIALECKLEPCFDSVSLQALRRPLQCCADIALSVISAIPHPTTAGYSLPNDPTNLSLVRKLLILYQCLGGGGAGLEALGRLLARCPPKHDLREECMSVSSWWSGRERVWDVLPRVTVHAMRDTGKQFNYLQEPAELRRTPAAPAHLAHYDLTPDLAMDSISYTYLSGSGPAAASRACARCGSRAAARAPAGGKRPPSLHAFTQRFAKACRCGGQWTLITNT